MGFGWTETLIILGILVLLFGSKKLPRLARSLGESLNVFKQEINDVKQPLEETGQSMKKEAEEVSDDVEKTVVDEE